MREAYELTDAIQWHEGMLLTPQHFQQMSLRQEQLIHYHMLVAAPFLWGVRYLKIDPVLLLNGRFAVMEVGGILPDGLVFWQSASETPLDIDLEPYVKELKDRDLAVHLIVPARSPGQNAFEGDLARYQSLEGKTVSDENTGEGEIRIPRLRPKLSLLISDEPPQKYISFPLARLTYKNETFALAEFIPPMLSVLPRSPLHDMGVMIATRAREKAAFLTERLRMPSYSSRMDKPMLIETQMIVQGLVSALPPLEAFLYSNTGHPYAFYLLLCGMAGSMAGYAGATLPPVFPAYNQNDLLATFAPVRDFINKILDSIHESYVAIAFQLEGGRFTLLPREEWLDRHFVIGVRAKQGTTEQDLIDWINDCVIGSSKHTQDMRDKRILGAARQRIDKDTELDLIPTRGIVLFRVMVDERFISKDDLLEIANTSNIDTRHRPSEVIFYARNLLPAESGKS